MQKHTRGRRVYRLWTRTTVDSKQSSFCEASYLEILTKIDASSSHGLVKQPTYPRNTNIRQTWLAPFRRNP